MRCPTIVGFQFNSFTSDESIQCLTNDHLTFGWEIPLLVKVAEPAWLRDSQPRMATPLRLENFGRINFSLGRWITRGKKTPKSMTPYVKVPGELVRIFFHSLLWPQRSLLYGFPPHCTKQSVFLTLQLDRICQKIEFHICQQCSFSGSTLPWLVFCMEITASLPAVVPFLATRS